MRFAAGIAAAMLLAPALGAAELSVAEVQQKMRAADASVRSLEFGYRQEMRSALAEEVRVSSGTVRFLKPRQFRIEQSLPERQQVVSSGKTVFVYTPRFKQVLKDSWGRWSAKNFFFPGLPGASEALQELIGGYRWEIRGTGKVGGDGVVEVLLKKPGKDGERLTLWLGTEDGIPRKTELASGTLKLTTTLSSVKLNPDLDRGLFRFEKPAGIEVIEVP